MRNLKGAISKKRPFHFLNLISDLAFKFRISHFTFEYGDAPNTYCER